jgi:hypothetical protein
MNNNVLLVLILFSALFFSSCEKNNEENVPDITDGKVVADFNLNWSKAWGTSSADDFAGSVIDNTGNMYFVGASNPDGYLGDIFLVKVNLTDKNVVWAKSFDTGNRDYFPSPSENGHSQGGGGPRCISIDQNGDVYIAGTIYNGFNNVFIMKVSNSGSILWQKYWKADNSGLAKGAAKAYSLDVKNEKVFITGSTGAGVGTEESSVFLLVMNAVNGDIEPATKMGIDVSATYNDRGYTVKANASGEVYIAGWEGKNNSGLVIKFSDNGNTIEWIKRNNIGYASRYVDIDFDLSGNVYLASDLRGVSTYIGIVKINSTGTSVWGQKFQGEANDRNNVSCLRVIDGFLYVGGRGSFANYDVSLFGDGCLLKYSLDGTLLKQYNYFTSSNDDRCGERIESIHLFNNSFILSGETWPEYSQIIGSWYIPQGTSFTFDANVTNVTDAVIHDGDGVTGNLNFNENTISQPLYNLSEGTKGSADVIIFSLPNL